jgi:hypothetical protein
MKEDMVKAVILILQNVDFNDLEILGRQMESAQNLLDAVALNIQKNIKCKHPEGSRKSLNTMGSKDNHFVCQACGEEVVEKGG